MYGLAPFAVLAITELPEEDSSGVLVFYRDPEVMVVREEPRTMVVSPERPTPATAWPRERGD